MPANRMTLDRIARQVRDRPDQTAVEAADQVLSYRELWQASDPRPSTNGSRSATGQRLGLFDAGDCATVVRYLTALRQGRSVVPLSTRVPAARTRLMVESAGLHDVILENGTTTTVDQLDVPSHESDDEPAAVAPPEPDEVFVIYTSGSTGRPKAAPSTWANLDAYVAHAAERYDVDHKSRVSHNFALTFDPSVFDLLVTWVCGGTVVLPVGRERFLPVDYVRRAKLTHWYSVPSAIAHARRLRALPADAMPTLQLSLFVGEPLPFDLVEEWCRSAPFTEVENTYGATELGVTCAGYRLPRDRSLWPRTSNSTVPIGTIYPHLEACLLPDVDDPEGTGQLLVRGVQRFGGYLDARLNASRFHLDRDPGPAGPEATSTDIPQKAWYMTGDTVSQHESGLVFLGRKDRQVKVSGFRIELGDVEVALARVAGVEQAATVLSSASGESRIVAYYTAPTPLSEDQLRQRLAELIPVYMHPAELVAVPDLPHHSNGKVDYQRLSAWTP